jgi:uncharacterized FlgJ-related protein
MENLIKFYNDNLLNFDWVRCSEDVKDFIICQFALESQFGKSRLAHDCNNYCGMRYPRVRIATSCEIDEKSGFAKYPSIYYCIIDYFLALQYHRPFREDLEDVEKFKRFISKFYCPERDYIERITKLFNQLKSYKNEKR